VQRVVRIGCITALALTSSIGCGNGGGRDDGDGQLEGGPEPPFEPLAAPPAGRGIQVTTPELVLGPGEETYRCYHLELPLDRAVPVSRLVSRTRGGHHFILYRQDGEASASGTLSNGSCKTELSDTWLYGAFTPDSELPMPEGVAIPFEARARVQFDMHFVNPSASERRAQVMLNLEFAETAPVEQAGALLTYAAIDIPPRGERTVRGTCTPPAGVDFFLMTTHTHRRGTLATVERWTDGLAGEELVRTEDWAHPQVRTWESPFLRFEPGQQFRYSCSFKNASSSTITDGPSAELNEMCMAIAYYYPLVPGLRSCAE
jgi:hypothetical protein